MKLINIKETFHKELDAIYGTNEVNSFFYILIDAYCNYSRIHLTLDSGISVTSLESQVFLDAIDKLKQNIPVQYILGKTEFFGLQINVNEHTLIPRPETEELVEWIIKEVNSIDFNKNLNILDIGTGSGCIAIALAKHLHEAHVYALDISKQALKVAQENAELNNVSINFLEKDILQEAQSDLDQNITFDIIVSNPPYVRNQEKGAMRANVLNYEPHMALFVDDNNPLKFYNVISEFAVNNLTEKGMLFFEINEYLGTEMKLLLAKNRFDSIIIKQDMFGKDRMIKGVKN